MRGFLGNFDVAHSQYIAALRYTKSAITHEVTYAAVHIARAMAPPMLSNKHSRATPYRHGELFFIGNVTILGRELSNGLINFYFAYLFVFRLGEGAESE